MEINNLKKCRLLRFLLLISLLFETTSSSPSCETDTKRDYNQQSWRLVITRLTRTCGENGKVTLPMEPPSDDETVCSNCKNILILKQIEGSSIPPAAFKNYKSSTALYLDNLGLEMISPGAFESLNDLEELHLNKNKLRSIYGGVLNTLGKLKSIDLSGNQIHSMKEVSLNGTQVNSVNLSSNFLTVIETDGSWKNITILDLSNNKISDLDSKVLPANLTVLNMSSNSLHSFNLHKNFTELDLADNSLDSFDLSWINHTMKRLNLKNNQITQIFGTYCHIKEIDLSGNKLNSVPCDCSHKSPEVEYLNLANNVISSIMPQTISELTNLRQIHLEGNQVKIVKAGTFASLQSLTYLNISHNVIENFEMGSVDNIKNVETFDISYNKLKQLKRYMMHTFANLKHLNLEYNNLTYINGTNLNDDLPRIWDINIVGNNLSCHNIWSIIWLFNKRPVHFQAGPFKNVTNIHGMPCYFLGNTTEDDFGASLGDMDVNKGIADYFNHDYRGSNFFNYLEEMRNSVSMLFNETWSIREEMRKMFHSHGRPEHLGANNNGSFNGYLITILLFLLSITCFIGFQAYILYTKFRRTTNDSERLL